MYKCTSPPILVFFRSTGGGIPISKLHPATPSASPRPCSLHWQSTSLSAFAFTFASILTPSVLATRFQGFHSVSNILLSQRLWRLSFGVSQTPQSSEDRTPLPIPHASILQRLALATQHQAAATFPTNIFLYDCACSQGLWRFAIGVSISTLTAYRFPCVHLQ